MSNSRTNSSSADSPSPGSKSNDLQRESQRRPVSSRLPRAESKPLEAVPVALPASNLVKAQQRWA